MKKSFCTILAIALLAGTIFACKKTSAQSSSFLLGSQSAESSIASSLDSVSEEISSIMESIADEQSSSIQESSSIPDESTSTPPPHEHSFTIWHSNESVHWLECACGAQTESSFHNFQSGNVCGDCGAETNTVGLQFALSEDGEQYCISGLNGEMDEVIIPATHEGKPVTTIAAGAFRGKTLKTVTLTESITEIGTVAFYGCTALEHVYIPASVTTIGAKAFHGCTALISATFESSTGWTVNGEEIPLLIESLTAGYLKGTEAWKGIYPSAFKWIKSTL